MLSTDYEQDQQRCELAGECREAAYYEGNADAVFGYKPQYLREEYLQGWWSGYKEELERLPQDRQGRIQYPETAHDSDQWLQDVGALARAEWGLPPIGLSPDTEF